MKFICKNCGGKKHWKLAVGEFRCRICKKDKSKFLIKYLKLNSKDWSTLIDLFLIGANSPVISEKMGKNIKTINKALRVLRIIMIRVVPEIFSGTVEVDETYLGGQKKNKNKKQLRKEIETFGKESKSGFGTTKQPVFGILARNGQVWAELVSDVEAKDLIPLITKQVKSGAKVCSDTWRAYTGLASKGYVHRTVEHGEKEYVRGKNHINGLEGFWGYLKRKLASKGGVRRKYLPLFLGEYVWRYNNKKLNLKQKRKKLLQLITEI